VKVKWIELESAYHNVSFDGLYQTWAVVDKETGEFYYKTDSGEFDDEEEFPEEAEEGSDRYAWVPDQRDLELGQRLVVDFVTQHIPQHQGEVRGIFSRSGAYCRYKDFLDRIGQLQAWYDFEVAETRRALEAWAATEGLEVVDEPHEPE